MVTNVITAMVSTLLPVTALAAQASEKYSAPQHIVSLSLCTDEMLLMLVEPARIAGVSYLARDAQYAVHSQAAQQVAIHSGLAEQIIAMQPDLIIGDGFERGQTVQMLKQLGYTITHIQSPSRIQDIAEYTKHMAEILGAQERSSAILENMQRKLANVIHLNTKTHNNSTKTAPVILDYAPNGYMPGTSSLKNDVLQYAGYISVADKLSRQYDSNLSLEQVLLMQPDVLLFEEDGLNANSMAHRLLQHPVLQQYAATHRRLSIPTSSWLCPGPWIADAVNLLANNR